VAGLLAVGLAAGAVLSLAASRGAAQLLYGLAPNDPQTLMLAICGLAAVALAAGFIPALRASKVDPMSALRQE